MAPSSLAASLLFLLLCSSSEARDFLVGGSSSAWTVPVSSPDSLNRWAESNRFQIGDTLVWRFDGKGDSVLQVTREGYLSCNTSEPIAENRDQGGSFAVKLDRAGPYYFISGKEGACTKGERVIVVVMARRRGAFVVSPAPSPAEAESPAVAPTTGAAPKVPVGVIGAVTMGLGAMGLILL